MSSKEDPLRGIDGMKVGPMTRQAIGPVSVPKDKTYRELIEDALGEAFLPDLTDFRRKIAPQDEPLSQTVVNARKQARY